MGANKCITILQHVTSKQKDFFRRLETDTIHQDVSKDTAFFFTWTPEGKKAVAFETSWFVVCFTKVEKVLVLTSDVLQDFGGETLRKV